MDISANARSYPLRNDMDFQGCIYYILDEMCYIVKVRMRIVVYNIHLKFIVVNFNASSTKDNAHTKLSRYV
jgi:hypothetical protein